jgi:SNF2 family DNA or RNA helicase
MTSEINEFNHIKTISQPKELKVPLYQHQLASIYQMEKREEEQHVLDNNVIIDCNIGVNADKTGYGKTLAMATLVYQDKMEWDLSKPFTQSVVETFAGGRIKKTSIKYYEKLDVTLVLASQSIIHQWYEECQKIPLSVVMITSRKLVDTIMVQNYDIILVTPTMYNKLVCKYSGMAWKRFIFDEPGHMKVTSMSKIVAGFIWLVTATPDAIIAMHRNCRNSFMYELICFAGWVPFSTHFDYMIIKNDDNFIQHSFSMPPTHHEYYKCYNPIFKTVQGMVTPNITEMISAGNIQGAIKALGGGETKNIAQLVRRKKEDELKELELRLNVLKIRNKKKTQIKDLEIKIKRLNDHVQELDNRFNSMLKEDCSICCSKIDNPVMETNCQNIFCGKCLLTWIDTKPNCPLCRDNIESNDLVYININGSKQKSPKKTTPQIKTKINTVISLIKGKENGKFIIFSAWDQTFFPIRTQLENHDIKYIEVKGGVEERKKNIENFKFGNIDVIFLNSRNNGSGINLHESTDIIVYHRMNESTLNQIIGRANRLGRVEPLYVHHLQI